MIQNIFAIYFVIYNDVSIREGYIFNANFMGERMKHTALLKLSVLFQIQQTCKPLPRRFVEFILNINDIKYGNGRVRIVNQRDQRYDSANRQLAVVPRIEQNPDIQTGDQQCKYGKKGFMYHGHFDFRRHDASLGTGRPIKLLLVGQNLFFDLIQPF